MSQLNNILMKRVKIQLFRSKLQLIEEFQFINPFDNSFLMDEGIKKQMATTNHKDKIFNVRKLHYKHFQHDKYHKPQFSPFQQKEVSNEIGDHKATKKGGQYNFQVAIISSAPYKQLNRRYCQLKQQQYKQKQQRLKQLKQKEEELLKFEAERQRLDVERERLTKKRDEIKQKLQQIRNRNESLRGQQFQRNEEYRILNMEYLRNMLMSVRYQNGIQIDPDNMTYEELLQLQQKMGSVSKGLTQEQFAKLPKRIMQKDQTQLCSICYEDAKEGQEVIKLPCSHDFHGECISGWLGKEKICPNCKQEILISKN